MVLHRHALAGRTSRSNSYSRTGHTSVSSYRLLLFPSRRSGGQVPLHYVTSFRLERPITSLSALRLLQGRYKKSWVPWKARRYPSPTSRVATKFVLSPDRIHGRAPHVARHGAPRSQMLIYRLRRGEWREAMAQRRIMGEANGRYYSSRMCGPRSSPVTVMWVRVRG